MKRIPRLASPPWVGRGRREPPPINNRSLQLPGGQVVQYRVGRWRILDEIVEEDQSWILRRRKTTAEVRTGDTLLASIRIIEIDDEGVGEATFWEAMDAYSSSMADLANTLLTAWPHFSFDVACYGNVMEISEVWVAPTAPHGIWLPAVEKLINRPRHVAVVIAKAFPLEYEGALPEGAEERDGFERRQAAMIRYYKRVLGLSPLPGPPGADGWMWRSGPRKAPYIEEPVCEPNWRDR